MSDIEWPASLVPQTGRFWLQPNTLVSESPLSRAQQVLVRDGDRWMAQMAWQNATLDVASSVEAVLAQARGGSGVVTLYDWRRAGPRGTGAAHSGAALTTSWGGGTIWGGGTSWGTVTPPAAPTLRVTAARGATSIDTWGWKAGDLVLRAGDHVGLGGQLLMVTADATATAGTRATLAIAPALRAETAAGTVLALTRPRARFRLVDNDQAANDFQPGPLTSLSIALVEALP